MVQATYRLGGVAAALTAFRRLCLGALILAAVLSAFAGRILARRLLTPVHHMTVAARRISARNLAQRLRRSGNQDELDRLAAVFNDMLARLEQQFNRIRQFTADAAHELRTPLAALRGNAEVALSSGAPERELRSVLESAIDEYDRLSRIADDLLLLSRADSGRPFLHRQRLCLHDVIQDVIDLFIPLAQDKNVTLSLAHGGEVEIDADGARIRQVLSNLLDNALKYTPAGGRITIRATQQANVAELTVTDSGPGIPTDQLPHIFERFYRADAARSRVDGGAGLGLAICRTIVEGHGGTITATNGSQGAEFAIHLPVNAARDASWGA